MGDFDKLSEIVDTAGEILGLGDVPPGDDLFYNLGINYRELQFERIKNVPELARDFLRENDDNVAMWFVLRSLINPNEKKYVKKPISTKKRLDAFIYGLRREPDIYCSLFFKRMQGGCKPDELILSMEKEERRKAFLYGLYKNSESFYFFEDRETAINKLDDLKIVIRKEHILI